MSYNHSDDTGYEQPDGDYYDYQSPNQTQYDDAQARLPSIFRAQQQPGFDNEAYLDVPNSPAPNLGFRLSTITERTERTEPSTLWHPRQQYTVPDSPRSYLSSVTTSYGKEIGGATSSTSRMTITHLASRTRRSGGECNFIHPIQRTRPQNTFPVPFHDTACFCPRTYSTRK